MILARKRPNTGFLAALVVCGMGTAVFALWVYFGFGGGLLTEWVDDLGRAAAALGTAITCLIAGWRHHGRLRAAWGLVGGSAVSWFAAALVRCYYELHLGHQVPFPSAADAAFVVAVPLAAAGLLCFTSLTLATLLDGAIIAGSLTAISWVTVLEPIYQAGGNTPWGRLIGLAHPIGDVVLLTMLVLLLGSRLKTRDAIRFGLVAAGFLAFLLGDSASTSLTVTIGSEAREFTDIGWVGGCLLIALAAVRAWIMPVSETRTQDHVISRWLLLLPYLPVAGAVAASLTDKLLAGAVDDFLYYDLIAVIVLVSIRQFVMLAENTGLNAALNKQTAALRKQEEQLRSLVEHSSDAATLADREGVIQFQSGSVQRMFAYASGELVGTKLVDLVFPGDRQALLDCLAEALKASARPKSVNARLRHKLGSWTDCEITITNLLYLPSVEALVINVRDISDRKQLEKQMLHQADHDSLTNLANRSAFRRALEKAVDGSALLAAILLIDLDDFRGINLALGSDLGDQLLAAVAARLEQNAPRGATVARLRSDEFAILLPGTTIEEAEATAESLVQQFRQPFRTGQRDVVLPVSIGVASLVSGHENASELLRNADLALQAAKASGKAKYHRFEPGMRQPGRADAA